MPKAAETTLSNASPYRLPKEWTNEAGIGTGLDRFLQPYYCLVGRDERCRLLLGYIRGLLEAAPPKRLSKIAGAVADMFPDRRDLIQCLQQFVGQSPWDDAPVRRRLAEDARRILGPNARRAGDVFPAWVVQSMWIAKTGNSSVGVFRPLDRAGRPTENHQHAVTLHLAIPGFSIMVDADLALPEEWSQDSRRCEQCGIPPDRRESPTSLQIAMRLLFRHARRGETVIITTAGHRAISVISKLRRKALHYCVKVRNDFPVWTPGPRYGRKPSHISRKTPRERHLMDLVGGRRSRRFHRLRYGPGNEEVPCWHYPAGIDRGSSRKNHWALIEWPFEQREPSACYLVKRKRNVPKQYLKRMKTLLDLAHLGETAAEAARFMKESLGSGDYMGRGWRGWHHHMTMVMVAHAFCVEQQMPASAGE